MLVDLNEEERDFLQSICARARLKLFEGYKYVTHKLDYDPEKLDVLREKLQRSRKMTIIDCIGFPMGFFVGLTEDGRLIFGKRDPVTKEVLEIYEHVD